MFLANFLQVFEISSRFLKLFTLVSFLGLNLNLRYTSLNVLFNKKKIENEKIKFYLYDEFYYLKLEFYYLHVKDV